MRGLSAARKSRAIVDACSKLVPLALVLEVLFPRPARKQTDARRIATVFFSLVDGAAPSDLFLDELILTPYVENVEPTLAAPPCSVPVASDPVRPDVAEWKETFPYGPPFPRQLQVF